MRNRINARLLAIANKNGCSYKEVRAMMQKKASVMKLQSNMRKLDNPFLTI